MFKRFFLMVVGALGLVHMTAGLAAAEVLLSVDVKGDGSEIRTLTDDELSALPQVSFTTSTIWTTESVTFSGPSLASVLEAVGAQDGALSMVAVNDYKVEMPRSLVEEEVPVVANRINGEPFSIRDKGPLWVVFPYDADARFQTEEIYSFSIWQLTQIQVVPD
ncbi:MAG: oxidoreductase [Paracoccaceae bacterium]|nr:oxidoreductase [Paracoccaceae bacterium]